MTPDPHGHKVLIVADDPLLAALVGGLVDEARFQPAFPLEGESADQALSRVRPVAALLFDGGSRGAGSDMLASRARKLGVELMLFGSATAVERLSPWAKQQELRTFALPGDVDELAAALRQLASDRKRARRTPRRRENTERTPDAPLVFTDAAGRRWSVYDRRGGERRGVDRQFVSESGEVLHCELTLGEAEETSASALERQLSRAHTE